MQRIKCQRTRAAVLRTLKYGMCALLLTPLASKATTLSDLAAAVQPGQWRVLSSNNDGSGLSGGMLAVESPANILQFADKGLWNPNTRQVLFFGEGHLASMKFISYTEATHNWQIEPKPPWDCTPGCAQSLGAIGHAYHHSTINPTNGDMYVRRYNSRVVNKFTKATNTWAQLPNMPEDLPCCAALEYFPESGALVAVGGGIVLIYEESTGRWQTLATGLAMGPYHNVAYYNAANRIVLFGGGNSSGDLYKIDASRTITKVRSAPVSFGINATINAVDPVTGRLLVFGNSSGYEYDVASNNWNAFDPGSDPFPVSNPDSRVADTMATAIPTYGVIMVLHYEGSQSRAYLYKHAPGSIPPPDTTAPSAPLNLQVQ